MYTIKWADQKDLEVNNYSSNISSTKASIKIKIFLQAS